MTLMRNVASFASSAALMLAWGSAAMAQQRPEPVLPSIHQATNGQAHGEKQQYLFMVYSDPTPGQEEEFNRWYDRLHAPYMIETGDFVWAQRFELAPAEAQFVQGGSPELMTRRFLVIFAIETDDIAATIAETNERVGLPRNVRSAAINYGSIRSVTWQALGPAIGQEEAIGVLAEETASGHLP
jgi:hypothetical protein